MGDATYADLLAAPPDKVAELIAGELYLQPRPVNRVVWAKTVLLMLLGPHYGLGIGGPGDWILLYAPELHLGPDVLVPDAAGWRRSAEVDEAMKGDFITIPPAWVAEVLAPRTTRLDRALKLPRYHAAGVEHVWMVDPFARYVEVYRWVEAGWLRVAAVGGEEAARLAPFEAVEVELGTLWVGEGAVEEDRGG